MRPLSFLIPAAGLLLLSCGGSSAPPAPERTLADVLDRFHPAATAFAARVSEEFESNALDPDALHRSRGFAELAAASQKLLPDFPVAEGDREHLAYFALCLGSVHAKPEAWKLGLHQPAGQPEGGIVSLELPPDQFGSPTFLVRLAPGKKKGWKLGSWPPLPRQYLQSYPADCPRLELSSWAAGAVPAEVRERFRKQYGSEIPAGAAYAQVEWQRTVLHHSLAASGEGADPWQRFRATVHDVFIPRSAADSAGLPAEDLVILADPAAPASLALDVLAVLAQPGTRWPRVWLGTPGEMVDACVLLDQSRAWEPDAADPAVTSGGSDAEWTAALAGRTVENPVGLRLDPALTVGAVMQDLERLKARGFTRIFIALPAKQE